MKPFYIYSRHIFAEGNDAFYRPGIQEQFLTGLARERKLPLLNLRLLMRDYDVAALYTSTSNHWNEQGNMAVAGIFLEEILPLCQKIKKGV